MGVLELGTIYLGGRALTHLHRVAPRHASTPRARSRPRRPPSAGTGRRTAPTCSEPDAPVGRTPPRAAGARRSSPRRRGRRARRGRAGRGRPSRRRARGRGWWRAGRRGRCPCPSGRGRRSARSRRRSHAGRSSLNSPLTDAAPESRTVSTKTPGSSPAAGASTSTSAVIALIAPSIRLLAPSASRPSRAPRRARRPARRGEHLGHARTPLTPPTGMVQRPTISGRPRTGVSGYSPPAARASAAAAAVSSGPTVLVSRMAGRPRGRSRRRPPRQSPASAARGAPCCTTAPLGQRARRPAMPPPRARLGSGRGVVRR